MATRNQAATVLKVESEADAFRYLQQALSNELKDKPYSLQFQNWPVLTISLEGDGYDSTVTSHMAEALVDLQHAMNRTYARVVRGSANPNVLTNEQKRSIEFKAKVEKGSSLVSVDLGDYATTLLTGVVGKMDGTQVLIAVLGLAIVTGSTLIAKSFLKSKSEDKKIEIGMQERLALSQEETKRQAIFQQALNAQPALNMAREEFDEVRHSIVKSVGDALTLKLQGIEFSNAEAKSIAATPRMTSQDIQLNGNYRIDKLDWTKEGEVLLSLVSTDDALLKFTARLNTDSLTNDKKEKLKSCEWERQKVYLSINATKLRGEITTATVVGFN